MSRVYSPARPLTTEHVYGVDLAQGARGLVRIVLNFGIGRSELGTDDLVAVNEKTEQDQGEPIPHDHSRTTVKR